MLSGVRAAACIRTRNGRGDPGRAAYDLAVAGGEDRPATTAASAGRWTRSIARPGSDLPVRQLDRGFDRAVPGRRPGRGRVLGLGQGPAAELATGWPPSRPAPPDLDLLAGGLSGPGLDRGPDSAHGRLPGRALAANLESWAQARPADRGHRMRLPGRCLRRAGPDVEAGGPPADARLVRAQPARPGR